jgi:hypothetical protein
MKPGDVAGALGKGLVAGMVGTAAMTVSSTIEAKLRKREGSTAPADAAGKVLGIQPRNPEGKARFSNVVHWAYGTSWGGFRGVLAGLGLRGPMGAVAHYGAVWGSELVMLPALEVAPPLKEWGRTALAIDAWHHLVYATATSIAYAALDRHSSAGS